MSESVIEVITAADGIGGVSSVVIGVSAGAGIISNSFGSSSVGNLINTTITTITTINATIIINAVGGAGTGEESGNIDDFRSIIIN
ncbi:11023_t:CDS:2 [Entrophospora sp. SA101]|nr:11023_t:CDS:2 [Entrophospora sp. SA101]